MTENLHNWADNLTYSAARVHRPGSLEELQESVSKASKAKALGTRHSFSDVADTSEDLIWVENMNRVVSLDKEQGTVTVEGGIKYGDLCAFLSQEGYALHNLASLPHISVAGAVATATHGSGDRNGNLSTAVRGLEIVKADGSLANLSRGEEEFDGAVVALGALGVVSKLTLDISPAFQMRQEVFELLSLRQLVGNFDEITSSAYSVSLFTHWQGNKIHQVWRKSRVEGDIRLEPDFYGASAATANLHPIKSKPAKNCTEQMGVPGSWHERMPHFRMEYTPSSGEELQSEYLIPREHAVEAIFTINEMNNLISPHLQVSEIRTIAADTLWLSPCYQQDCVGIHFTWKKDWPAVSQLLPAIEEALAEFQARPHWGKLFHGCPKELYPRLNDFKALATRFDPQGKFHNAFLERYLF